MELETLHSAGRRGWWNWRLYTLPGGGGWWNWRLYTSVKFLTKLGGEHHQTQFLFSSSKRKNKIFVIFFICHLKVINCLLH